MASFETRNENQVPKEHQNSNEHHWNHEPMSDVCDGIPGNIELSVEG